MANGEQARANVNGIEPSEPTPLSWLFAEIERRFGSDAARDLHAGYLAELRQYQAEYRERRAAKRERKRLQ